MVTIFVAASFIFCLNIKLIIMVIISWYL